MNIPRGYLSPSQIETYQRCPKQYEFRYIKDVISPPSAAMLLGSSVHKACEHTHRAIASGGYPAPTDEVEDVFSEYFVENMKLSGLPVEDEDRYSGAGATREYNRCIAPTVFPASEVDGTPLIEYEVRCDVAGVPMLGYVDLVDFIDSKKLEISDIKTSGKSKSQTDVDNSLQLTFYAMVLGIDDVRYDNLVTTKKPKAIRLRSKRTEADKTWLEQVVASVANAISAGAFPACSTDSWCCSDKWCGYWHLCRGAKR